MSAAQMLDHVIANRDVMFFVGFILLTLGGLAALIWVISFFNPWRSGH